MIKFQSINILTIKRIIKNLPKILGLRPSFASNSSALAIAVEISLSSPYSDL